MSKLDWVDVLVALQNGKEVESSLCGDKWDNALNMPVGVFLNPEKICDYKFRLSNENEFNGDEKVSNLISGKEALIALANGEEVEFKSGGGSYRRLEVNELIGHLELRLKPKTIKLNNIEVPAPFEPKDGEFFYCLSPGSERGYSYNTNKVFFQFGAWRTEDEIKQVVEALKSVFKPQ